LLEVVELKDQYQQEMLQVVEVLEDLEHLFQAVEKYF
jgi:hypothetical protein